MKRASRFVLVLALVLVPGRLSPARADEAPLGVEVEVGWDGLYVDEEWTPVRVTLTRPAGSPALRGRVSCEPLPLERVPGSHASFEIPAVAPGGDDARVRVQLAVPARGDLSYSVRVEDELGRELLTARPRDEPRKLDKDRLVVLAHREGGLAALDGVPPGAGPAPPAFTPGRNPRAPGPASPPSLVRVVRVGADALPDRAFLLASAAAVVLEDGRGARDLALDATRVEALETFCRSGGALVVVGGTGTPFWVDSPLDELLPVEARGDRIELAPAELDFLGEGRKRAPVAAVRARLRDRPRTKVVAGTEERPLVVSRELGRGRITFIAFDPDARELRGASELGTFLGRLLPPRATVATVRKDRLRELSARTILERAPIGPGGLAGVALTAVATVVILGPIAARRRKGPARAFVAPGLSVLLATTVVGVAWATRGGVEPAAITYVFAESGATDGLAVSDLVWFAGDATELALELRDDVTVLPLEAPRFELVAFRSRRSTLRVQPGAPARVEPIELAPRGVAWIRAGGWVELPARLRVKTAGDAVEVEALGGPTPAGLVLSCDRQRVDPQVIALPALAAGERKTLELEDARPLVELVVRDENDASLWERSPDEASRALLVRTLKAVAEEPRKMPPASAGRFPRTWAAVPIEAPRLAKTTERGVALPQGRTFTTLVVAAEEEP